MCQAQVGAWGHTSKTVPLVLILPPLLKVFQHGEMLRKSSGHKTVTAALTLPEIYLCSARLLPWQDLVVYACSLGSRFPKSPSLAVCYWRGPLCVGLGWRELVDEGLGWASWCLILGGKRHRYQL